MDNLAEALKFATKQEEALHARSQVEIDGRQYTRERLTPVEEPEAPLLELHTLTGLVDYLATNVDSLNSDGLLVHVVSPVSVALRSAVFGAFKQREVIATAVPILPHFQFDDFMSSEQFTIGLNAMFTADGDRDSLLADVASIKVEAGAGVTDNGTSQTVSMSAGARLVTERKTKPRVTLHPFCTFQEIQQPARQFLFRLSEKGQPGLFVADGEAWRNKAMLDIKEWLTKALPEGMHIIA